MRSMPYVVLAAVFGALLYWVAVAAAEPVRDAPVEVAELHGVPQGHVYTTVLEEPVSLNPLTATAPGVIGGVFRYTYDGLLDWEPATGALRGAAAKSWEVGEDGRTVRFAIREGLRFANGDAVTADDLTFCWDLAEVHGDAFVSSRLGSVMAQVRAVRWRGPLPGELEIELASPGPRALGLVGAGYWILPRAHLEACAGVSLAHADFVDQLTDRYRGETMGTGPYQAAEGGWSPGSDLLLTRNPHAWHRQARPGCWNFAGIRRQFPQALGEPELALEQGLLDVWVSRGRGLLANAAIAEDYRYVEYVHPLLQPYRVQWNLRDPSLGDVRVRRALSLLTDRERLVAQALGGAGQPATGPFAPGHPGTLADVRDPRAWERGRALLAEAGFDAERPLELELLVPSGDPLFESIAAFLTDAWRGAGVAVRTETLEFGVFSDRVNSRRFQGAITMDQDPFPVRDLYPYLHSSQVDGLNECGYKSAEADRALEAIRAADDGDAQRRAEAGLVEILAADQPVLWLLHRKVGVMLHRRIDGVEVGAMGLSPERFWVAHERQRPR